MAAPGEQYVFYHYEPSMAAAVLFVVLFGLSTLWHVKQMVQSRTWFFIPFVFGGLFETIGYVGRALSAAEAPAFTKNPFIIQSTLLLLGPALYAASMYMMLGRLVRVLDAGAYALIPPRWLTKFFVLGDVLSFCTQGGGGGLLVMAKTPAELARGNNIILGGLGIQIAFFGLFVATTLALDVRLRRRPTGRASRAATTAAAPGCALLWVLYATSGLVLARSLFRVAEFAEGRDGRLQAQEAWLYGFDAVLMLAVSLLFNWWHPSRALAPARRAAADGDVEYNLPGKPLASWERNATK